MIKFLTIFALAISCHAQVWTTNFVGAPIVVRFIPNYTNGEIEVTVVLSAQDQWAAKRQMERGSLKTNAPAMTVSNYFATMFHNQVRGFTGMELQQFEWERRARVANAPRDVQDKIHAILGLTNGPPPTATPPVP
jgi:hypothetical protein